MKIRPTRRALFASLLAASGLIAPAGCASTRKATVPQPTVTTSVAKPKKEYAWQDMSAGKSFFRPIGHSPD